MTNKSYKDFIKFKDYNNYKVKDFSYYDTASLNLFFVQKNEGYKVSTQI